MFEFVFVLEIVNVIGHVIDFGLSLFLFLVSSLCSFLQIIMPLASPFCLIFVLCLFALARGLCFSLLLLFCVFALFCIPLSRS